MNKYLLVSLLFSVAAIVAMPDPFDLGENFDKLVAEADSFSSSGSSGSLTGSDEDVTDGLDPADDATRLDEDPQNDQAGVVSPRTLSAKKRRQERKKESNKRKREGERARAEKVAKDLLDEEMQNSLAAPASSHEPLAPKIDLGSQNEPASVPLAKASVPADDSQMLAAPHMPLITLDADLSAASQTSVEKAKEIVSASAQLPVVQEVQSDVPAASIPVVAERAAESAPAIVPVIKEATVAVSAVSVQLPVVQEVRTEALPVSSQNGNPVEDSVSAQPNSALARLALDVAQMANDAADKAKDAELPTAAGYVKDVKIIGDASELTDSDIFNGRSVRLDSPQTKEKEEPKSPKPAVGSEADNKVPPLSLEAISSKAKKAQDKGKDKEKAAQGSNPSSKAQLASDGNESSAPVSSSTSTPQKGAKVSRENDARSSSDTAIELKPLGEKSAVPSIAPVAADDKSVNSSNIPVGKATVSRWRRWGTLGVGIATLAVGALAVDKYYLQTKRQQPVK